MEENTAILPTKTFNKKSITVLSVVVLVSLIIYISNYLLLQSKMNEILKGDPRNQGLDISVHYSHYINPNIIVYDVKEVSGNNSMADVFRVFLQFADGTKEKKYTAIELAHNNTTKFILDGESYQVIGNEYSFQNPIYTIRTFPEKLKKPDGTPAYSQWSGGVFGVLQKQMEDFNDVHKKWYLDDMSKK